MFSFPLLCFFLSAWSLPVGPTRRGWPRIEVAHTAAHGMAAGGGGRPHGRMHAVGLPANLASTTCIRISHARRLGTEARELASPTRRGWAQRPSLATPRAAAARPQPLAPQPPARVTARRGHLLMSGSSPSPPQAAAGSTVRRRSPHTTRFVLLFFARALPTRDDPVSCFSGAR